MTSNSSKSGQGNSTGVRTATRPLPPPTARSVVLEILLQREEPGDFLEHRLDRIPGMLSLSEGDRRLAREIAFGVLRNRSALDHMIASRTDGRPQRPVLRGILQMGVYQLLFLDRVPDHAVVNEAVVLARLRGFSAQSGFVNAVLRGITREKDACRQALHALRTQNAALGWSHPNWLVERWAGVLSESDLQRLLAWNNAAPATIARVNRLRTTAQALMARWQAEGVEASPVQVDWADPDTVFSLTRHPALETLGSFREGGFYVQDPSTLMAVQLLDPQPGERILDLCSAPGGKALAIAERMQNTGCIVAHDAHAGRLELVRENAQRLGAAGIELQSDPELGGSGALFDRVLVDAPCSNTGVLRRRIELRWRIQPDEITRLAAEQAKLLRRAADRVRPGGVLVYSTCSLEPEENDHVVDAFLRDHPGWTHVSRRTLHPVQTPVDGAFAAKLLRVA
jgi:16S rRNA (cytosine967-C5)-methyltransferase